MRRFVLLIALLLSLTTLIPSSLAEEVQANNEKSEVKLNTAITEPEKITYDEKITIGNKAPGEDASFWVELINNVINKVEDIVDSVKDWYENSSFATKVLLAAIIAFIATIILVGAAVVAGLIAGVSALGLTIVGLVAALVAAAYSIFTGEENFSLLESVLVGITGGLTAAFLAFTAAGAAIVAAVQSGLGTAWVMLSRRVLPAVGRFILTQSKALWGLLTQRVIPAIGRFMTQRVWPFVTTRIWNPLRTFFTSTLFRSAFVSGLYGALFNLIGKMVTVYILNGRFITLAEMGDSILTGFLTTFIASFSVELLVFKGLANRGGLSYFLAVGKLQFSVDLIDKFIHGELGGYTIIDAIAIIVTSVITTKIGIKIEGSIGEIASGGISEVIKFFTEVFKKGFSYKLPFNKNHLKDGDISYGTKLPQFIYDIELNKTVAEEAYGINAKQDLDLDGGKKID